MHFPCGEVGLSSVQKVQSSLYGRCDSLKKQKVYIMETKLGAGEYKVPFKQFVILEIRRFIAISVFIG